MVSAQRLQPITSGKDPNRSNAEYMGSLPVTLIFCGGGNQRFAQIAIDHGYKYGARLPHTIYHTPVYFADQDWKKPNRKAYMDALAKYKPVMATVLDWERVEQLPEVLSWAEEAAQYVEQILIIPKVLSMVDDIPRRIGGADIVLAYSVPSRYGGTQVPIWEFAGWPIHLLGGSPQAQMQAYLHLQNVADVVSADGNYAQKMAVSRCQFYLSTGVKAKNRYWPTLAEVGDGAWLTDAPYEAFRRSCVNIAHAWATLVQSQNRKDGIA